MPHPPLPWKLLAPGPVLQTVQLVDVERVRPSAPPGFDFVAVAPGRTLGGIYYARYGTGSTAEYNELGVFPAVVRFAGRRGIWVAQMYVDSEVSLALAHETLGLPKELAEFSRPPGDRSRVEVRQGGRLICAIDHGRQFHGWRQRLSGGAFGLLGDRVIYFGGRFVLRTGVTRAKVHIPPESPLSALGLDRPLVTFCGRDMAMVVGEKVETLGVSDGWGS